MDNKQSQPMKIHYNDKQRQVKYQKKNTAEVLTVSQSQIKANPQTACEFEKLSALEIVFDKDWMETCINSSPRLFQDQLQRLVEKTIHGEESFFKRISYFFNVLVSFTKEQRFLLNWNIFEILGRGRMKPAGFRLLFKQQHLLRVVQDSQSHKAVSQKCVTSVRNVLQTHYRLYKAEGLWESQAQQQDAYLQQFEAALSDLSLVTKESHFLTQTKKINRILHDFMKTVYRNQFVLIVTNLLEILRRTQPQKYFAYFLHLWQQNIINKNQLSIISQILKQIHIECIKMASQFESNEQNNKRPFKKNDSKKKIQFSNKSTMPGQNESNNEHNVSLMSSMQESSKIYVKEYISRRQISSIQWINQTYVKYIEVDRDSKIEILKLQLQAKAKQNQLNLLRYLQQLKKNYVFKFDITTDNNPETKPFQRKYPKINESKCFEFQSRKADKDYATRVNECFKKTITKEDLWAYKDRNLLYHFIFCFALSISQLERHSIHHLDFSYDNFIKFYQIFEVIDFEHAYVVNKSNQQFLKINRELFSLWLQSSLYEESLHLLIASDKRYSQCKGRYFEEKITKQQAIDECINLMHQNMKKSHYEQFHTLCQALLKFKPKDNKDLLFSQREIKDILQEIPQNLPAQQGFYDRFAKRLQVIYERYCPKRQIIGKSEYILKEDSKDITNPQISQRLTEKTVLFIEAFKKKPLKYCLQYSQIRQHQKKIIGISRRDHKLFNRQQLLDNERILVVFLQSCLLLLAQAQENGILLLNLCPQLFVRSGEAFIIKNFAYLFKIGPKLNETSIKTQQDQQLSRISLQLLTQLCMLESSEFRDKLFNSDDLKNIYKIASSDHNVPAMQRIRQFYLRRSAYIHFEQYKQLALSLLEEAKKCFIYTEKLKVSIEEKNIDNFYELLKDLRSIYIEFSYS